MSSTALVILNEIAKALSVLKADAVRQKQHEKAINRNIPAVKKAINDYVDYMQENLYITRLRGKNTYEMANNLADWDAMIEYGKNLLSAKLADIFAEGSEIVMRKGRVQKGRLDPLGMAAADWATKAAGDLIADITNDTKDGIRKILTDSLKQGLSIQQIARKIRPSVGLNKVQQQALKNLEKRLIDRGFSPSKVETMLERYAKKAKRYRAEMIARTESARALTKGQVAGYKQMGVKNLKRVEAPDACPECAPYNGKIYKVSEASDVLPAHPHCRGTWVASIKTKRGD